MASRAVMTAAGVLWGLLLGTGAGLLAAAVAAGAGWLFLFGDDPWPWWAEWAILGAGLVVGVAVFLVCLGLTRMVARRYDEREAAGETGGGSAIAWLMIAAALAAGGYFVWSGYRAEREADRAAASRQQADVDFRAMVGAVHRIERIEIDWPGDGRDGTATVVVTGWRAGRYRLDWSVQERAFGRRLVGGGRDLTLQPGTGRVTVALPARDLVAGYRAILERPDASVMVDEVMDFMASLEPDLAAAERQALPPHEVQNLRQEWSDLIDHAGSEMAVRFYLFDGRLSWDGK